MQLSDLTEGQLRLIGRLRDKFLEAEAENSCNTTIPTNELSDEEHAEVNELRKAGWLIFEAWERRVSITLDAMRVFDPLHGFASHTRVAQRVAAKVFLSSPPHYGHEALKRLETLCWRFDHRYEDTIEVCNLVIQSVIDDGHKVHPARLALAERRASKS